MRWLAAALMLAATTSAQAQTYDPVEILPTDIPAIPASSVNPPIPTNLGDDATKEVDLGFTFNYFGQDFTKAWISSNGFVSFQSSANLCCNGQPLEQAQRNTIYEYWTDLINWTGTPYYSKQKSEDGINSLLVGWYGTYEYGGNRSTSFEMYLYDTGAITFNYIKTYDMQGHTVTAGLTGPTADDNILLFYGSNTSTLSGKAYSFNYQTGTVTVDCNISPMDPSCASVPAVEIPGVSSPVDVTPVVDTTPTTQEVVTQVQEAQAAVIESVAEQQVAEETVEETIAAEQASAEQVVAEQQTSVSTAVAATSVATKETTKTAERLNPSQLAALNAGGSSLDATQSSNAASSDGQQSGDSSAKASMQLFTSASTASIAMAEMEQQQQLQSSVDSSLTSSQTSAGSEQNLEMLANGSQLASQSTDGKTASVSYQDQQKLSGIDSNTNKDSATSTLTNLQPDQVMGVIDTQQYAASNQQQVEEDKSAVVVVQVEQSSITTTESRWQESLSSQNATLEALNTISNTGQQGTQETQEQGSSLGEGQAEVISQMAYVPGFSAYKLVSLPDRPDFYKPRRIYKNNRPVDAYMSIFKMTAANDNLWKQMVESQYE